MLRIVPKSHMNSITSRNHLGRSPRSTKTATTAIVGTRHASILSGSFVKWPVSCAFMKTYPKAAASKIPIEFLNIGFNFILFLSLNGHGFEPPGFFGRVVSLVGISVFLALLPPEKDSPRHQGKDDHAEDARSLQEPYAVLLSAWNPHDTKPVPSGVRVFGFSVSLFHPSTPYRHRP